MGKQRKRQGQSQDFSGTDKPEYAHDWFREEKPKKPQAEKKAEDDGQNSVKDHLGKSALDALTKLKTQMVEAAAKEEAAKAAKSAKSASTETGRKGAANGSGASTVAKNRRKFASATDKGADGESEASFAELFDPVEPDDASFEDMLKQSKLDWRAFKD